MKTAIISFRIYSAKLDVLKSFISLFLPQLKGCQKIMEILGSEVSDFEAKAKWFSDCLLNHRFNLLTEGIQGDDVRRDKKWTAVRSILISELDSNDPECKRAAEIVYKIFESFGKVRQMGYAEQSGAMASLCSDLLQNHKEELELLEIERQVEDLQEANNAFIATYQERTESMSEHSKGESQRAREALCEAYRLLIFLINAHVAKNGTEGLEEFIEYTNTLIEQYRIILKQGVVSRIDGPEIDIPLPPVDEDSPSDEEPESPEPENPGEGGGDDNPGSGDNNQGGGSVIDPDNPWYDPENEPD